MNFAYQSDIGKKRQRNEDSSYIVQNKYGDVLMMVFDGMGGHHKGDVASSLAQSYFSKQFKQHGRFFSPFVKSWIRKSIIGANHYLNSYTSKDLSTKGMGTTFACFFIHRNHTYYAYVGDSRCYIIFKDKIKQVSKDETYLEYLFELGQITRQEMINHPSKNVITNALGCYNQVSANVFELNERYDRLLLCSDGLYNMVSNEDILKKTMTSLNVDEVVTNLINQANVNGGVDNIAIAYLIKE